MKAQLSLRLKRLIDIIGSVAILIVTSPLLLILYAAIKLTSPGPAIFRQERIGQHGKPFTIFKFRTMVPNASQHGAVTSLADPKITSVGRVLRLTSLDELPQLINVLRNEMSLVGPRPLVAESLRPEDAWRHTVKPGCTSLAIANGRQTLEWAQRMEMDRAYVEQWSLALDLQILLKTVMVVLRRQGVYNAAGEMPARPPAAAPSSGEPTS